MHTRKHLLRFRPALALPLLLLMTSVACVEPGFTAESGADGADGADGDGPALITTATLGERGHATVHIEGRRLGPLFGLSFHVTAKGMENARTENALAFQRTLARAAGDDLACGGTQLTVEIGEVELADGALCAFDVVAAESGDIAITIEDAVARKADASFVPCAVAGGTLTLEGAR